MTTSDAVVARARACVGVRFRAQGRDPAHGLDCVGLAAHALGRAAPGGYAPRGDGGGLEPGLRDAGLAPIAPMAARAGDLLVVAAGPAQRHLVLLTDGGFVHAHAGLRRVVETPGAPPWPAASAWRPRGEG